MVPMVGRSAGAPEARPQRGSVSEKPTPRAPNAYERVFLHRPKTALSVLCLLLAFFAYHAKDFRLDASADSLLLEDDPDLRRLREITARYGARELLIVTFTPHEDLFSDTALAQLARLRNTLRTIPSVESVTTILDVPLLQSSDAPLAQLAADVPTLESGSVDRGRARRELVASPIFGELLISRDGQTTGLMLALKDDPELAALLERRTALRAHDPDGELDRVSGAYDEASSRRNAQHHEDIERIREILAAHRAHATVYLGGVPMIAKDMIAFVRSDLVVFGSGVFAFLVIALSVIFRDPRWVALPLLSCVYAGLIVIGMLGLIGWKVTVVSSNFLSLMLIMTISMNIHLAVRYRQLLRERSEESQVDLVSATLRKMVWPCLYTALTTIIGFSSLVFSDIKPVQDFGWMMSVGLGVAFATSFTIFPAALVLMGKPTNEHPVAPEFRFSSRIALFAERHGTAVFVVAGLAIVASGVGISRLEVENSFIDYFSEDTEIYRGMKLIDERLGGTTPLDILLHMNTADAIEESDDLDEDEDWFGETTGPEYWFTPLRIERVKRVHDYLDGLPEVGKVLSLASIVRLIEARNGGEELDSLELGVLYRKIPAGLRSAMVDPFFDHERDEARIQLRILDSREGLRRAALLERIEDDLHGHLGLGPDDVSVAGTLVLYNNVLQSLYRSQISSLAAVLAGVGLMFLILFRSLRLSLVGIVPNVLAAGLVLGLMGLAGIPLDIMTITIAAITIGIAVDNSIHYIYRFREEYPKNLDYTKTLHLCHSSIGRAVFYTSTTIVFGFSILALSNFLPMIYFGVLTGLALLIALLAALTLLPKLIQLSKPMGAEVSSERG